MNDFQPILLGSDINAYGMARAFHEAYGIASIAFAYFQLSPTKFSKIIDVHVVPHFSDPDVFLSTLEDFAHAWQQSHPSCKLLLVPCGDVYSKLLSQVHEQLHDLYAFHYIPEDMARRLSMKDTFYEICEAYHLPHPKTLALNADDVKAEAYKNLPFDFPIAMKPANSTEWLSVDFPGRKKAFIIDTPQELEDLIQKSYAAGYTDTMILQEFIPGDDSHMRVLNAYVDQHHRVRMMFLAHPLLEDPTPEAIGNYAAIIPDYNEEICMQIKAFLEDVRYVGFANFDLKYDERDHQYKLFEINLRQGRSSYCVTLNGYNLARYLVDDLIADTEFDGKTIIGKGDSLWLEIPRSLFKRYVADGSSKDKAMEMLHAGKWGTTLSYSRDRNIMRWLQTQHMFNIYKKRYPMYFRKK